MGFSCKISLKPIHWNQLLINSMDSQGRFFWGIQLWNHHHSSAGQAYVRESLWQTRPSFLSPFQPFLWQFSTQLLVFLNCFGGYQVITSYPFPQYIGDNWGWSNSAVDHFKPCHFSEPISQISFYGSLESSFYRSRSGWSSLVGHVTREMLMNRDMLSSKADA